MTSSRTWRWVAILSLCALALVGAGMVVQAEPPISNTSVLQRHAMVRAQSLLFLPTVTLPTVVVRPQEAEGDDTKPRHEG